MSYIRVVTCIYMYTCICICKCIYVYIHSWMNSMYIYIYIYIMCRIQYIIYMKPSPSSIPAGCPCGRVCCLSRAWCWSAPQACGGPRRSTSTIWARSVDSRPCQEDTSRTQWRLGPKAPVQSPPSDRPVLCVTEVKEKKERRKENAHEWEGGERERARERERGNKES
jgi:hypothetical protein